MDFGVSLEELPGTVAGIIVDNGERKGEGGIEAVEKFRQALNALKVL